jgi:hypothetical protein
MAMIRNFEVILGQMLLGRLIKENKVGGPCGTHGGGKFKGVWWESQKRPLGRPRRRCEDGIRMDIREIAWGRVEWIQLAQDRGRWGAVANTVMNLWVLAPRS